jgi:hypothetical protein
MKRLRVHRNPHCARCAGYARMHQRLDWLGRIDSLFALPAFRCSVEAEVAGQRAPKRNGGAV